MNISSFRSFLGLLLGFIGVFFLFVRREKNMPTDAAEALLILAQAQLRDSQAKNRERAVAAITQKNNLQAHFDQTQNMVDNLQRKAQSAHAEGDFELERQLLTEQERYQPTLERMKPALQTAIVVAEEVKDAMRQEEAAIRARTAEALAMKAQLKQVQIEWEIEKSRLGLTTSHAADLFALAQAKIQQAEARRDLTIQIRRTAELLEIAAEEAINNGNKTLSRQLLSERDALKQATVNPHL